MQVWIKELLPKSSQFQVPMVGLGSFIAIRKFILSNRGAGSTNLAIYEGSLSWAWFLVSLGATTRSSRVFCNLFPASRIIPRVTGKNIKGHLNRINIRVLQWIGKNSLVLSFDTQSAIAAARNSGIRNIELFPLVSALEPRSLESKSKSHFTVLVNVRDINHEKIINSLENSCEKCCFVFPNSTFLYLTELGFTNVQVPLENIPNKEYERYIDSFDYMILLYAPALDSSGKLLDAIVRDIPLCIPKQSVEMTAIAAKWGRIHRFDPENEKSLSRVFSHPPFEDKSVIGPNPFSPKALITHLASDSSELDRSGKTSSIMIFCMYFASYPIIYSCNLISRGVSFSKNQFQKVASNNKKVTND